MEFLVGCEWELAETQFRGGEGRPGSSWKARGENMNCLHALAGAHLTVRGGSS